MDVPGLNEAKNTNIATGISIKIIQSRMIDSTTDKTMNDIHTMSAMIKPNFQEDSMKNFLHSLDRCPVNSIIYFRAPWRRIIT